MERDVKIPIDGAQPLGTVGVTVAQKAEGLRPADLPATTWISFRGDHGTFPRVALRDVLDGEPQALAKLRGKIVLLGIDRPPDVRTSAPGTGELDSTEIQANMMSTALDRFPLNDGERELDIALITLLGLLPVGLALLLRPALIAPAVLAAVALFCLAAQLAFGGGRVISVVYPLASLALASIGVAAVLLLRHRAARATQPRADAAPT